MNSGGGRQSDVFVVECLIEPHTLVLGEWMIALRNGSTVTILATSAPFNFQFGQDYTVRADLNGSALKLYVGGVLMVSTTDSTFTSGKIGFSVKW